MTERPTPDLTILETRVYRGANIWSYEQAIHLVVDLGRLEDHPTNTLPGFTEHLLEMLPGLQHHSCSVNPGRVWVGWSSRRPRSTTRWMACS